MIPLQMPSIRPNRTAPIVVLLVTLLVALTGSVAFGQSDGDVPPAPLPAEGERFEGTVPVANRAAPARPSTAEMFDDLRTTAQRSGSVRVIVQIDPQPNATRFTMPFDEMSGDVQQQVIANAQQIVLSTLDADGLLATHRYTYIPFLALTVTPDGLDQLRDAPGVRSIVPDQLREPLLNDSTLQIGAAGADGAWAQGYTGSGQTVAILDTGVDKNHPFLQDKVIYEACYSTSQSGGGFVATSICPGGVSESTAPNSALPCVVPNTFDSCDHGTHLAGIAAGKDNGSGYNGVAPDATIIAMQVFSRLESQQFCFVAGSYESATCIRVYDSDAVKALEQVYSLRDTYNIAAVNLSFGSDRYFSEFECEADNFNAVYIPIVGLLTDAGIAVVASAGNNGYITSMNAPACLSDVVSVSSVGRHTNNDPVNGTLEPDGISWFSNAANFLDLLAPGYLIDSSIPNSSYIQKSGTSQAAPHVTGAFAVLRQFKPDVPLEDVLAAMTDSGVPILDVLTGLSYPRLQLDAALDFLVIPDTVTLLAPEDAVEFNVPGIVFEWTPGADTDEYVLRIKDETDKVIASATVPHADCTEVCTATITEALTDRDMHTWQVIARNSARSSRSAVRTFFVDYPGKATLLTPENGSVFGNPADLTTITWEPVETATSYKLKIKDLDVKTGAKVYAANLTPAADGDDATCDVTLCTFTFPQTIIDSLIDDHRYEWFVQARNDLGKSKSEKRIFIIDTPGPATLLSPADDAVLNEPADLGTLVWGQIGAATEYKLVVKNKKTKNNLLKQTYTAADVCDGTICTVIVPDTVRNALSDDERYQWKVQSRNNQGESNSEKFIFTTDFPGAAVLETPGDMDMVNDPSALTALTWEVVPSATEYKVQIKDTKSKKKLINQWYPVTGSLITCDVTTCTFAVPADVRDDLRNRRDYKWKVKSRNELGKSNSEVFIFTTDFPGTPTLLLPVDTAVFNNVSTLTTLQWTAMPFATEYRVRIRNITPNPNNTLVKEWYTVGVDEAISCDATTCGFIISQNLRDQLLDGRQYDWQIQARNDQGKSKSVNFTFTIDLDAPPPTEEPTATITPSMTLSGTPATATLEFTLTPSETPGTVEPTFTPSLTPTPSETPGTVEPTPTSTPTPTDTAEVTATPTFTPTFTFTPSPSPTPSNTPEAGFACEQITVNFNATPFSGSQFRLDVTNNSDLSIELTSASLTWIAVEGEPGMYLSSLAINSQLAWSGTQPPVEEQPQTTVMTGTLTQGNRVITASGNGLLAGNFSNGPFLLDGVMSTSDFAGTTLTFIVSDGLNTECVVPLDTGGAPLSLPEAPDGFRG